MNENTKKLLQNVCIRNSSDGDDDETVDGKCKMIILKFL